MDATRQALFEVIEKKHKGEATKALTFEQTQAYFDDLIEHGLLTGDDMSWFKEEHIKRVKYKFDFKKR